MSAAKDAGRADRRPLKFRTERDGAPVREQGTTVIVAGLPLTVVRYLPRDDRYLLETQDGFHTRRWYAPNELDTPSDAIDADGLARQFYP